MRRSREGKDPGRRRSPEVGRPGAAGRAGGGRRGAGGGDPALGGWGWGGKRAPGAAGRAILGRRERAAATEGRGRAGAAPPQSPAASGGPWAAAEGVGREAVGSDPPPGLPSVSPSVWQDLPSVWVCVGPQ